MKLQDVLHYYLGSECEIQIELPSNIDGMPNLHIGTIGELQSIGYDGLIEVIFPKLHEDEIGVLLVDNIKPILRRIGNITDSECVEWYGLEKGDSDLAKMVSNRVIRRWLGNHSGMLNPTSFHYLLKQGFDLFGLIESGQALDKTK